MGRDKINRVKPILIDLYCKAGGATKGYQEAGFYVIGVDIEAQPNYIGDRFIQADAIEFLANLCADGAYENINLSDVSVIHASPPCQAFTAARVIHGRAHPDLLTPTRALLCATSKPWVIENVPGAPMRVDLVLCGSHFNLHSKNGYLRRHRQFEFWAPIALKAPSCAHKTPTISVFGHGGHVYHGVDDWREVMGINWMSRDELAQAIPPTYTKFIGEYLQRELTS